MMPITNIVDWGTLAEGRRVRRPQCYPLLALDFEAAASESWTELDGDKI
jgi:hypothetical protein